ncbi:S-layer homology domain-containing protein [Paenibacillus sp. SC116]|uniref:S-layer homology domain-containing protein n=1 Tax=Paenibacillus sp. SC116 TaxID=2968986 RepID=UPI00215A7AE6|nr:S-layer homology domain-containing protein [Paenibacillus sp. SC116]MCR8846483.1 S-layer homology domain-containing protein [Paenibacillus sp. SC116]
MTPNTKKVAAFVVAATIITGYAGPLAVPAQAASTKVALTKAVAVSFKDLSQDSEYAQAIQAMIEQKVIAGYKDNTIKPNQHVNRAELAKMVVLALELEQATAGEDDGYADVAPGQWFHRYVATLTKNGVQVDSDKFQPRKQVTQQELVNMLANVLEKDGDEIQAWISDYAGNKHVTRAQVAQVLYQAQLAKSSETVITNITPLNSVTLQVTFSKPLTPEEVNLDNASKNFVFNNDLKIVNVPQLKTGATQTYIVPTTTQKAGTSYTLKYRDEKAVSFTGTAEKIQLSSVEQVTNDTVQVISNRADGVVDYGYVIAAYRNGRGALAMQLDENNRANGVTYEIIPSLRSRTATLTPNNGGAVITANYVPFTQSTDGRQAPKFRLPQGTTLQPGVTYTITSDWMEVKNATFTAAQIAPLALQSAKPVSPTSLEVTLVADPKDELLAGRSVTLTAADGSQLTATYKFSSRKGATGTFDIANNGQLKPGTTYTVTAVNGWATANQVTVAAQ